MSNITSLRGKLHPAEVIAGLDLSDITQLVVVFKKKDGSVGANWSTQTNEELGFKALCIAKWAMNNIGE